MPDEAERKRGASPQGLVCHQKDVGLYSDSSGKCSLLLSGTGELFPPIDHSDDDVRLVSLEQTQLTCDHCVPFTDHRSQIFILSHSPFIRTHVTCVGFSWQPLVPDCVHETELTSPGQCAVGLGKRKLGVTRFQDQNLKVPYVKDGCPARVWGQRTGLG